jgi:dipeptidyl aminopeptidase/acylaminoacyl peptidase
MRILLALLVFLTLMTVSRAPAWAEAFDDGQEKKTEWQKPPEDILKILHAPHYYWTSMAPGGKHILLADLVLYNPLADLAAPMHKLAGMRVNPLTNNHRGGIGIVAPRLIRVEDKTSRDIMLPSNARIKSVNWTANGKQFALSVELNDHLGLWVGSIDGVVREIKNVSLNPLLGSAVQWLPDQKQLLIKRIPERGPAPEAPAIPAGPEIMEGAGASARSTYEARNLLETPHDDELFEYFTRCELIVVNPGTDQVQVIGQPGIYSNAEFSPDGKFLLVERLMPPWSHEVAWWRFAQEIEIWDRSGALVAKVASLPLADQVPVHGEPLGPRSIAWRPTHAHQLYWIEALDGGNPAAEAPHRDRLMCLDAPFNKPAREVFRAKHRIQPWMNAWGAKGGMLMLTEVERIKRWRYTWLVDVDNKTSRLWLDLNEDDRYGNPGNPLLRPLPNGFWVLHQKGSQVYFTGNGASKDGDRPFLDLRDLKTGQTERLFRCDPKRYEYFMGFVGDEDHFIMGSESSTDPLNYHLASLGARIKAAKEEGGRSVTRTPITHFKDPAPELRQIEKQIVHYKRKDGVPLSFHLYLPPGYQKGTPLPTILYAYPLEYSSAAIAGQVSGSTRRFVRLYGASHLYFLLRGYAVLDNTAMPMIGDPETTYDTFIPQLVADAEAAVAKAVEMGVTDPKRIGIIGHSHGGLMVANLLAHTDLFAAGIARSGSYNKTNQPFGFQSERRSLFQARDVYINVSPTFFADKVNEPVLIIHGNDDSNPGTLTNQSEVFYEAVRGSGGTARLVLLPFEDHGYSARESIEHVLWEQLRWFDKYLKNDVTETQKQ